MIMRIALREDGFTLTELLFSTAITLVVLATAMSTFQNALMLNETATLISDSNQNLRAGTNALVRDLMQAGRDIPTGGISIPSGGGATPINRPSPPGQAYQFDNVTAFTMPAIITGAGLGPITAGEATDMITFLSVDPASYVLYQPAPTGVPDALVLNANPAGPAGTFPVGLQNPAPTLSAAGSTLNITAQFATWISDPVNGIRPGDLLLFKSVSGASTIQTVTAISPTQVICQPGNATDWFNFNQPLAAAGSILALRDEQPDGTFQFGQISVSRVIMLTYYVDATMAATPRLVRLQNNFAAQALAGVVEDLEITYDLVDGTINPVQIESLPYTTLLAPVVTFTANQIRKVNLHMGVRSEEFSQLHKDFMRHHITTTVSVRNLAFVDKYQ
jgi:Tfp pilus assembly protein FimT